MKQVGGLLLLALASSLLTLALYDYFIGPQKVIVKSPTAPVQYTKLNQANNEAPNTRLKFQDFTFASKQAIPAVVNVRAFENVDSYFWASSKSASSSGSGVIINKDGYIVTNFHVIEDGSSFEISLADGQEYEATLMGTDPSTDLALLKIEGDKDFPQLFFGDSDSLSVGEWVLAVGNPYNLESTVTAGIVSAKGRSINILEGQYSIESFIQTDAAVNPGNSGGALINSSGQLVGINTAIITRSGKFDGYSFAVPSNLCLKVVQDLIEYGIVQRAVLGVSISKLPPEIIDEYDSIQGVLITQVERKSGAYSAGLRKNDIIVGLNDDSITNVSRLQELVARYRPGDEVMIRVVRKDNEIRKKVVLHSKNHVFTQPKSEILNALGFFLQDLTPDQINKIGSKGAYVSKISPHSIISETNMVKGLIITNINNITVEDVDDVKMILGSSKGEIIITGVYEDAEGSYIYTFEID